MSRTYGSPSQETSPKDDTSNASQELHKGLTFSAFCKSFRKKCLEKALIDSMLPVPPKHTIAKTLYSLGVPRERLRFVILWMCDCVPFAGQECAKCGHRISKAHLESCVVRSPLPVSRPGKGIDTLLHRAVSQSHAPSALLAFKIITEEVVNAFPPRCQL